MGGIGLIILLFASISGIQILLSLRKSIYPGLLIPILNALIATILGMMGTDYFMGYFIFIVLLLPIIMWLAIYKVCRMRVKDKNEKDMRKLRVKDL